ncbi:MAG: murein L,D-transpeptidase family protein [Hyphomicrobium sp.]|nr:murein L,D-transpeptidase family protein [Hyphomicrobium sp.]
MADASQKTPKRDAGRTFRRFRSIFLFGVIAIVAAIGALSAIPPMQADRLMIGLERQFRLALYGVGATLPGTPDLAQLDARLSAKGLKLGAPVFMRVFKREFLLELWIKKGQRFEHFATYPICKWSGALGPKLATGDRQSPEGVYTVGKSQLNPNSRWYRSFNLGFPNAYDQAHDRTGSFLMVHGGCGSIGCYAMTNAVIGEIWEIVTKALDGGQPRFQVQVFPFRMTDANLARYAGHRWEPFWRSLKPAHDLFEADRLPPVASVCNRAYEFRSGTGQREVTAPIATACPASRNRTTAPASTGS